MELCILNKYLWHRVLGAVNYTNMADLPRFPSLCFLVSMGNYISLLEIFIKILTKNFPSFMQDSEIMNHGRIRPENGTIIIADICVAHARY